MASDEEDIIFIGESKTADLGTEKEDFKDKDVAQEAKSLMRKAYKEVFLHIKKRIKISADEAKTTKSIQSSSSGVKTSDMSFNERKHKCIMCGEVFENFTDIKVHLFQAHSFKKQSQCDICGEFFSDQMQFEIHKQTHKEAETTSSFRLNSVSHSESNKHDVDVTKASMVESVQEKPLASELNSGNINKENTGGVEYLNKSAENVTDLYKSKVNDNTGTKKNLLLPLDKLYVCKICNNLVFKSYMEMHKNACSQSSSSIKDKIFGSQKVHDLVNNNIADSGKGVIKKTCQENETSIVDNNISDDNITMVQPHVTNVESSLLQAKTCETDSVNQGNPEKTSSLTKRSDVMSLVFVTTHNNTTLLNNNSNGIVTSAHLNIRETSQTKRVLHAIPLQSTSNRSVNCIPFPTNVVASTGQKTGLPISLSQSNVALSVLNGSLYKPTTSVVSILKGNAAHTLPMVSGSNALVSNVMVSTGQKIGLPIPLSQSNVSNVAFSVHDGSLYKPTTSVVSILKGNAAHTLPVVSGSNALVSNVMASTGQKTGLPISLSQSNVSNVAFSVRDGSLYKPTTAVVSIQKENAAHALPVVSGSNALVSFVAPPNGILSSASQMAYGTHNSFIHLATPRGNIVTVPEANLSIPSASHTVLANRDVSTQVETVVKSSAEVCNLPSTDVEKVAKQQGNVKSSKSSTNRQIYSCPICKKGLSKSYVMQHMSRMHQGEKPFKCEICHKTFCKKLSLTKHIALKHEVKNTVANSENENNVCLSLSNDINLTVKGNNIADLDSNMRIFKQNVHETAMSYSNPTAIILGTKVDSKNSYGNLETSQNEQSVLGYSESGDKASKFLESLNVETQIVNRRICENDQREEILSCGKNSSLDVNGLVHNVNDVEGISQETDLEIIELEILSDANVVEKQNLSDALHERRKQKFNQSTSKLKRICKLCSITFYDRKFYRWHMRRIHSKQVSSKANVQCHQCGKLFLFHRSLKEHLNLKHPKK